MCKVPPMNKLWRTVLWDVLGISPHLKFGNNIQYFVFYSFVVIISCIFYLYVLKERIKFFSKKKHTNEKSYKWSVLTLECYWMKYDLIFPLPIYFFEEKIKFFNASTTMQMSMMTPLTCIGRKLPWIISIILEY